MNIGKKVESIRKQQGISQYKLSKLSNVSQAYISHIESGKKNPTIDLLAKICNALGIEVSILLKEEELDEINGSPEIERLTHLAQRLNHEQLKQLIRFIETMNDK